MLRLWTLLAFTMTAVLTGCSKAPDTAATPAIPTTAPADGHEMASAAAVPLSAEDQTLADRQKVCPVGGEALGSMGTPVKVMLGDRAVFLCCEGCRSAVKGNPEKYLAKLDAQAEAPGEAAAAKTEPAAPAAESTATPVTETPAKPE